MKRVSIIGLGYVGLPLALLAEAKGFQVIGVEKSKTKLAGLKDKTAVIDDGFVREKIKKTKIDFTDEFSKISSSDVVIVCVPTPVDEKKNPDISLVTNAVKDALPHIKNGALLVIESTINPGVCDEIIIPLIENSSDHVVGKSIQLAHCPERINPGDPKWNVSNINRVVGSNDKLGLDLAYDFYSQLIGAKVKKMGSIKEAEAVKIVENTFRDINIAFVNELAMSFNKLGINVKNVIDGAATKPFAFMPHYPGIGVGGHCIPVDPYYLIEYARGNGFEHKFLSLARSINENMPIYSIDLLEQALIENAKKTLKGSTITLLGLSYKANVGDDRESPAYVIIKELEKRGAFVKTYDPHIMNKSSASSISEALENADGAILVTGHTEFLEIPATVFENLKVLLDGRNTLGHIAKKLDTRKTTYIGIGG